MIQRRVVVPTDVDRLWRALTDPEQAGAWLGGCLEWTPEAGRALRFRPGPDDRPGGPAMDGRVEAVIPGRYLRFRWWPEDAGPDGASEVAYFLEPAEPAAPDDDPAGQSTILTVEEAPVATPAPAGARASVGATSSVSMVAAVGMAASVGSPAAVGSTSGPVPAPTLTPDVWTDADSRRLSAWAADLELAVHGRAAVPLGR